MSKRASEGQGLNGLPPHPATVAQPKVPHPATVVQRRVAHPATVQGKALPPHPATVPRRISPQPAEITQTIAQAYAAPGPAPIPPHPARIAPRAPMKTSVGRARPPFPQVAQRMMSVQQGELSEGALLAQIDAAYTTGDLDRLLRIYAGIGDGGSARSLKEIIEILHEWLKKERAELARQDQNFQMDSKSKVNRASVACFAHGELFYMGSGNEPIPEKGYFVYRSGHDIHGPSKNQFPEHLPQEDNEAWVSRTDSEVRLLDQLETFLVTRASTHLEKGYQHLVIQIRSVNGACNACKKRISTFVQRMLRGIGSWSGVTCPWKSVVVRFVYKTKSIGEDRFDRDRNVHVATNYGNAKDPELSGINLFVSGERYGQPLSAVSLMPHGPGTTSNTTAPMTSGLSRVPSQETDPRWLEEALAAYQNNPTSLEELARMIMRSFHGATDLQGLYKEYLRRICARISDILEQREVDDWIARYYQGFFKEISEFL